MQTLVNLGSQSPSGPERFGECIKTKSVTPADPFYIVYRSLFLPACIQIWPNTELLPGVTDWGSRRFGLDSFLNDNLYQFTRTHIGILACLASLHSSNNDIAHASVLSVKTVRNSISEMINRLNTLGIWAENKKDMIAEVWQRGLLFNFRDNFDSGNGRQPKSIKFAEIWPKEGRFPIAGRINNDRRFAVDINLNDQLYHLSGRELDILGCLIAKHSSHRDIGFCLGITGKTARNHISSMIGKFGDKDSVEGRQTRITTKMDIIAEAWASGLVVNLSGKREVLPLPPLELE